MLRKELVTLDVLNAYLDGKSTNRTQTEIDKL